MREPSSCVARRACDSGKRSPSSTISRTRWGIVSEQKPPTRTKRAPNTIAMAHPRRTPRPSSLSTKGLSMPTNMSPTTMTRRTCQSCRNSQTAMRVRIATSAVRTFSSTRTTVCFGAPAPLESFTATSLSTCSKSAVVGRSRWPRRASPRSTRSGLRESHLRDHLQPPPELRHFQEPRAAPAQGALGRSWTERGGDRGAADFVRVSIHTSAPCFSTEHTKTLAIASSLRPGGPASARRDDDRRRSPATCARSERRSDAENLAFLFEAQGTCSGKESVCTVPDGLFPASESAPKLAPAIARFRPCALDLVRSVGRRSDALGCQGASPPGSRRVRDRVPTAAYQTNNPRSRKHGFDCVLEAGDGYQLIVASAPLSLYGAAAIEANLGAPRRCSSRLPNKRAA
jgi:hypothetical protein